MKMMYKIKLENLETGATAYVEAPAHQCVETLSPKIKVALHLPYADHAWHRFVARGITYVVDEHEEFEPEFLWEYDLRPGPYRSSERISLRRIFTTLGSSILYTQDRSVGRFKVRCTLVQRA